MQNTYAALALSFVLFFSSTSTFGHQTKAPAHVQRARNKAKAINHSSALLSVLLAAIANHPGRNVSYATQRQLYKASHSLLLGGYIGGMAYEIYHSDDEPIFIMLNHSLRTFMIRVLGEICANMALS